MKAYQKAIRMVFTMALSCVLAIFLGLWIDEILHTTPWIMLLLLAYAIGGSIYMLIRSAGDEDG